MEQARTAMVAGGGIAGAVAAIALRKAGIAATIYEAYPGGADGIGGALMLAPNGLAALDVVGAGAAVRKVGSPTPRMVMETGTGKRLGVFEDLPGLPTSRTFARPDLYVALLATAKAAGAEVIHGKRLAGYDDRADEVVATFADGSTATADVLLGADGLHSTVRTLLDPQAPEPKYTGLIGFGGWVSPDGLPSTEGAMHFAFGKRAFFGYLVEPDRAGWFANLSWAHAADRRRGPGDPGRRVAAAAAGAVRRRVAARLRHARPGTAPVSWSAWVRCTPCRRLPVWQRGRVALVGDSAHATSPSSGQGASMSIESAVELGPVSA